MKICLFNETKSFLFQFPHKLITLFHFLQQEKKRAYLPLYVFEKTRVSCYKLCKGKQKYQFTNVGVEKINLSPLLVQRINEIKMNEIQRKTPQ